MLGQAFWSETGGGALRPLRYRLALKFGLLLALFLLLSVDSLPSDQHLLLPVVLILALAPMFLGAGFRYRFSTIKLIACVTLLFLSVHWLISDWPWMSLWLGACLALLPVGVIIASKLKTSLISERDLLQGLVIVGVVNSALIIYESLFVGGRQGGFLDDPNLGANVVGIALLCLAYLYLSEKVSPWMLILAGLLSAGLFFAQSRGAWLALGVSGVVLAVLYLKSKKSDVRRLTLFVFALVVGFLIPLVLMGAGFSESLGLGVREKSLGYRFEIWASAWELIVQRPFLGSGIGTFPLRYPLVRSPDEISTTGHFAHSDIIQLVTEVGLVGASLFFLIPLIFAITFFANIKKHCKNFDTSVVAFCVLSLVALHGLVNFIIYQPLVALTVGLLVGFASKGGRKCSEPVSQSSPALRRVTGIFCVSLFSVVFVSATADLISTRKITDISESDKPYNLQSDSYYDLLFLEMFSPLNVNVKNYIVSAEVASALGLNGTEVGFHFRKRIIERIERNRRYYEPNCFQLSERGRLLWLDDQAQAVAALNALIAKAPDCYQGYLYLSEALVEQKQFSEAERTLDRAFQRFKFGELNSEQAGRLLDALAEVLRRQGRESEAISIRAFKRAH